MKYYDSTAFRRYGGWT